MSVKEIASLAKNAKSRLQSIPEEQRIMALESMATALENSVSKIIEANEKDLTEAKSNNLSSSLLDRLTLTDKSIRALGQMCRDIANQPRVVGEITEEYQRPNGLIIQKQRIPIGVIGMIFESRPNVVVDGAALAIKSGNAIILKGGKEAFNSNKILFEIMFEAVKRILPEGSVSLVETREDVAEMLTLHESIDLMVPRGGSNLIEYVKKNATMPVVAHDKGLCHIYVHDDADTSLVVPIILNSKVQRPGVCNATESLLIHEKYPQISQIISALIDSGVEIRGCEKSQKYNSNILKAIPKDYETEYLDKIISLKIVINEDDAIEHIQKHSSHHTEAILARSPDAIEKFLNLLDASAIMINTSTRFNDGGELGLGAELGISTSKLHAYGPMGAREMTTTRFLVKGNGQIR
jgi:glutamate-5-semialdehyde dehydrogenase